MKTSKSKIDLQKQIYSIILWYDISLTKFVYLF